jgi:Ca-activated chloride channel homolog
MTEWLSLRWLEYDTLRDFRWANLVFLYGLLALPLIFWFRRLLNNRNTQRLNVAFLAKDVRSSWISLLRHVPGICMFLALALVLLALARPQKNNQETEKSSEGIDIVLALDVSTSMSTQDIAPSRLEVAKTMAKQFIEGRFQDRIGLVVFSGEAATICPLTTDHDLVSGFVDEIKPDMIATSGTAIGTALGRCINRLQEVRAKSKVVILLSDGANTAGSLDPVMAARLAQAYHIRIYTISVGTNLPNEDGVDESTLRAIARQGNGSFFRATDARSLGQVFGRINQLEKIEIRSKQYQNLSDYYYVYLRWAILFLLLAFFFKNSFMGNVLED